MEQEVKIKEEPVCFEGTTSFDSHELVTERTHLKEEIKSEVGEPGQTLVNISEPCAEVKDEIFIEEPAVGQLVPCFKEEDSMLPLVKSTSKNMLTQLPSILSVKLLCEMDQNLEIKEEPVCFEGTAATSFDSHELVSEKTHLKEEIKSEVGEPGRTREKIFELSAEVKNEIFIEEPTVCQLVPCFKEEDSVDNFAVFTSSPVELGSTSCKVSLKGRELKCPTTNRASTAVQRPHCCIKCGKTFQFNCNLLSHMLIHTAERPHNCSVCRKAFKSKPYLDKHMITHTVERPHNCSYCGKAFSRKYALKLHMLLHKGDRLYACNLCDKTFITKGGLQKHMLTHSGERGNVCIECGKKFSLKDYLKKHMLIHTGERPHSCCVCNKTFSHRSDMTNHMKIHTEVRQYCCHDCGKTFAQRSGLKKHLVTHTAVPSHN